MVGNTLEFGQAFDRNIPGQKAPQPIVEERNVAMWRYRLFQSWFNRRYILIIGSQGVNPCYLFNRSLIGFAAAACLYVKRWENNAHLGVSPKVVEIIVSHIRSEWQDLLRPFQKLCQDQQRAHTFSWTGPDFRILPRDESQVWKELQDWPTDPVYGDIIEEDEDEDVSGDDTSDGETIAKRAKSMADGVCYSYIQSETA
jgi:hypothetical protein